MKAAFHVSGAKSCGQCHRHASFMRKALPSALALVFSQAGWTDPINASGAAGLPFNGVVRAGDGASGAVAGSQLTITQTTDRAVIDWSAFNIDAGKTVQFVQPAAGAVLNRVNLATNASQIAGALSANGMVMLMNPHGVVFNQGSSVNVGALIATTGTIAENTFSKNSAQITGATAGVITNQGNITATAGASGLVALVAPSVINQGVIAATGGTIALLGSTATTISLNNGLYEFAIPGGATGTAVTHAAGASLNAANLYLGVGDAANLLSGVINLEGVLQASSAIVVNGDTVVLKSALQAPAVNGSSNTVNVTGAARIQDGVNIAKSGGAVKVAAGTYVQPATLKISKSLTLSGAGQDATIIDAQAVTGYGIQVTADGVTLKDFTLYGPTANVSSSYGIKLAPTGGTSARLLDFAIRNVTIRGSARAELDLNGVVGAVIDHVTADGAPVGNDTGSTAGAGIQITDSAEVTVSNSITRHNQWGGLALYQANRFYDQQVNNITITASNSFTERNPVYLQDESASRDLGTLSIAGFDHAVRNSASTNSNNQYTWLQASQQKAFDFAVNLGASSSSYVLGWNGALTTQNFEVGTGNLLAGGTQAMSIGAAVGAASAGAAVDVFAGTYAEQLVLNKAGLMLTGHDGAKLVVPDATEVNGINIAANNVSVTGMEIAGPATSSYLNYAWGNNITRGIAVGNGITGFAISNNNVHDVRNGILIHGNNTGNVTGNRIDNTKSAISVQYTDGDGITMTGNTQGTQGNEWGLNLHLNGHMSGSTIVSNSTPISAAPTSGWQQALLDLSAANAGWSVQDQAYTSSNRTHVNVAAGGSSSAQGSALTPLNTVQGGVFAVVNGGVVNVASGTYSENVTIGKALTLNGAGAGQSIIKPGSGDAVTINGNIGSGSEVLIDGFTFSGGNGAGSGGSGVKVASGTTLGRLTLQNSMFRDSGIFGFYAAGTSTAGLGGVGQVVLQDSTFTNNGNTAGGATALGLGDIQFNYYNGDATLKNLHVTGTGEHTGIHFRGYHDAGGAVKNAGTVAFDNVLIDGTFLRPGGSVGTWNPGGPGYAIHLFEYDSVANVSFNGVAINNTVGHGIGVEGLGSTLDLGNTRFGQPDTTVRGAGTNPTSSANIVVGSNTQNNVKSNINATRASFTGASSGFAIEDRVIHALDGAGVGLVTWNAGNVYVTQASGSIQRGVDAAGTGDTVNVANASFAENVTVNARRDLAFNDTRLQSLTLNSGAAGSGMGGTVTAEGASGILLDAPVRLLANTTLATTGANITLNGDIQNAGGVTRGLRLLAGTGAARGNVHMNTGGSAAGFLGQLDVSSNAFSLERTLWVSGYKIDALGKVTLSNHTLRAQDAGASNTLNAGGSVTGSTISQGKVEVISAGDIQANIAGTDVTAQAQGAMDVVVTASQTATLTADTIVANIKAADVVAQSQGTMNVVVAASGSASLGGGSVVADVTAPVVAVQAVNDAQVSGSASQITLNAPRGSVSGSFGQVSNTGGGLVNVNGKPQTNQTVSSNAENNRVIPASGVQDSGGEGGPVQLAQTGDLSRQGGSEISLGTPEAAGDALDGGRAIELDMSPRNQRSSGKAAGKTSDDDRKNDKEQE